MALAGDREFCFTLILTLIVQYRRLFFYVCGKRAVKPSLHRITRHFAHLCQDMPLGLEGQDNGRR
jgi:hypothetical protein